MAFDWFPQQPAQQQSAQADQGYITRDELQSYIRSDSFRSVMRNQNSDLYEFGSWQDFTGFDIFTTTSPYTSFASAAIGSDGKKRARYTRIGETVIMTFTVSFGNNYTAPPDGRVYCINTPVQPADPDSFNVSNQWFVDNNHQTFCGSVYVYGGASNDWEGPIAWIHPSVKVDPVTGGALSPGRIFFVYGQDTLDSNELYNNQWFFASGNYSPGGSGYNTFPTSNSVITGLITYEASPTA